MRQKILTLLMVFLLANTYAQNLHIIKFIHRGDELKPVGTIIVSIETIVPLVDRPLDFMFGKSFKTDSGTYNTIRDYIQNNKYVTTNIKNVNFLRGTFEITTSDGFDKFIIAPSFNFYKDLVLQLKLNKCDEAVTEAFERYGQAQ